MAANRGGNGARKRLVAASLPLNDDRMTIRDWYQFKLFIEHAVGISMDALHIIVGFAIFLLAAVLLRRSVASLRPWLATLLFEMANEALDLQVELWPDLGRQLGEGLKDVLLTMALPTLLLCIARRRPSLLTNDVSGSSGLADDQMTGRPEVLVAAGASAGLDDEHD